MNFSPATRFSLAFVLGCLLLAGCSTGDYEMVVPIAGGGKIHVPITHGAVPMTKENGIEVTSATFVPNKDKQLAYVFSFTDRLKRSLRSVQVDDVSDETKLTLLTDHEPKSAADGSWRATTEASNDLSLPQWAWLTTVSSSERVYLFTLTFSDGKTLTLYQCTPVPDFVKEATRKSLGLNY